MAEVKMNGPLFKVTMTEYDDGAQHKMGEKYFDNEYEAKQFCTNYASGSQLCYWRATYKRVS